MGRADRSPPLLDFSAHDLWVTGRPNRRSLSSTKNPHSPIKLISPTDPTDSSPPSLPLLSPHACKSLLSSHPHGLAKSGSSADPSLLRVDASQMRAGKRGWSHSCRSSPHPPPAAPRSHTRPRRRGVGTLGSGWRIADCELLKSKNRRASSSSIKNQQFPVITRQSNSSRHFIQWTHHPQAIRPCRHMQVNLRRGDILVTQQILDLLASA